MWSKNSQRQRHSHSQSIDQAGGEPAPAPPSGDRYGENDHRGKEEQRAGDPEDRKPAAHTPTKPISRWSRSDLSPVESCKPICKRPGSTMERITNVAVAVKKLRGKPAVDCDAAVSVTAATKVYSAHSKETAPLPLPLPLAGAAFFPTRKRGFIDDSEVPANETPEEKKRRLNRNNERRKRARRLLKMEHLTEQKKNLEEANKLLNTNSQRLRDQIQVVRKSLRATTVGDSRSSCSGRAAAVASAAVQEGIQLLQNLQDQQERKFPKESVSHKSVPVPPSLPSSSSTSSSRHQKSQMKSKAALSHQQKRSVTIASGNDDNHCSESLPPMRFGRTLLPLQSSTSSDANSNSITGTRSVSLQPDLAQAQDRAQARVQLLQQTLQHQNSALSGSAVADPATVGVGGRSEATVPGDVEQPSQLGVSSFSGVSAASAPAAVEGNDGPFNSTFAYYHLQQRQQIMNQSQHAEAGLRSRAEIIEQLLRMRQQETNVAYLVAPDLLSLSTKQMQDLLLSINPLASRIYSSSSINDSDLSLPLQRSLYLTQARNTPDRMGDFLSSLQQLPLHIEPSVGVEFAQQAFFLAPAASTTAASSTNRARLPATNPQLLSVLGAFKG